MFLVLQTNDYNTVMNTVLILVLVAEFFLGASILLSIFSPFRIWPPPKKWSWQFFYTWGFVAIVAVGFLTIGITTFEGFGINSYIGGATVVAGEILRFKSIKTLSLSTTVGLKGKLVTNGLYAWSRNPMYIADMMAIVGAATFFNTPQTWIIVLIWCAWFLLAPLAEEPWLIQQHGEKYVEYMKRTPRFVRLSGKSKKH